MIDRNLNSASFLHAHLPYGIVSTIDPSAIGSVPNDSDSKYQNPTEGMLFLPFHVFGTLSPFHLQMQLTLPIFARVLRDSDSSRQISIWLRLVFAKFTYVFRNSILTAGFRQKISFARSSVSFARCFPKEPGNEQSTDF
jgi:hypothetical protein